MREDLKSNIPLFIFLLVHPRLRSRGILHTLDKTPSNITLLLVF